MTTTFSRRYPFIISNARRVVCGAGGRANEGCKNKGERWKRRGDEKKLFLQNYFYDEDLSGLLVSG